MTLENMAFGSLGQTKVFYVAVLQCYDHDDLALQEKHKLLVS